MEVYKLTVITAVKGRRDCILGLLDNIIEKCDFEYLEFIFSFTACETYSLEEFYKDINNIILLGANVKVLFPEKRGIYPALNHAIVNCSTDYFTFLHSDDRFEALIDFEFIKMIAMNKKDVITFDVVVNNIVTPPRVYKKTFPYADIGINHMATVFKTDFHKNFLYDESYQSSSDWKTVIKMFEEGANFETINRPLVNFSLSGISNKKSIKVLCEDLKVIFLSKWSFKNSMLKLLRASKEIVGYVIF